ncbi:MULTISPECIES: tyrosine-type recombinase/integrase [Ramlibacter]|uniref:Tyrosine-type recombinase/integrase n=1 Tax=Ramlibacter aquaticus TaxID=2780094 RepID=A0ABR9SJ29_9BURK|nr:MULTISPECIES: tyrosine-type recombinase/integrase [Ramlibacter]MBE7942164.1 tyrosine-type recombinase/integrase [Ramlibacter aquaticus]
MSLISLANNRLAAHHFAFLRALAEGLPVPEAARRYLRIETLREANLAYKSLIDQVQALARRQRHKRWRLVGIEISTAAAPSPAPSIDDWAAEQGLDGWSHEELQDLYAEQFGSPNPAARRRAARNERLRQQRLQLLRDLESVAGAAPSASDPLDGWLEPGLAERLGALGALTLGDLQGRIARGGRWWRGLRAFGPVKAARLARLVELLLGETVRPALPLAFPAPPTALLAGDAGTNRAPKDACAIAAANDREAIRSWVAARAGSAYTAAQYEREAERFMLWCVLERRKALSSATPEDCRAYMDFLQEVPAAWISRRKVPRLAPGWAPFKGQLSHASRALALAALHSLFSWLVHARYLASNPWALVNRKVGEDPAAGSDVTSRAFTPEAWAALYRHLKSQGPTPSSFRLLWLLTFLEATGLRAQELLRARRADLKATQTGWVLHVHGKGRRNRTIPVPSAAVQATQTYFQQRGIDFQNAPADTPLLASLTQPAVGISYRALHETLKRLVKRVAADWPAQARICAARASAHWLRHTHATRAAERQVPLDVLQENLGHSDPRTTTRYYRAQIARRQAALERAFGGSSLP